MERPRRLPLTVVQRYVLREFGGILALTVAAFVAIYLIVDTFDRIGRVLKFDPSMWAFARYMVFKIPMIVTQVVPPAVLASTLLTLGLLGRRNELIALRASGIGLARIGSPLLLAGAAISICILVWNETVVPFSTHQSEVVNLVEIRRQAPRTILSDRETWYHGADGFYDIDHIDKTTQTLYGLMIYRLNADFQLLSTIEVTRARWTGSGWDIGEATEHRIGRGGNITVGPADRTLLLQKETIDDFVEVYRDPEELSYAMLNQRLHKLARKGIDTAPYLVDLHLKLAVPFMSLVLAALAIPIAGWPRRHVSVAAIVGTGVAVGFSYWVILGLSMSLGQSGALPPVVAAWSANAICSLVALFLFLSAE